MKSRECVRGLHFPEVDAAVAVGASRRIVEDRVALESHVVRMQRTQASSTAVVRDVPDRGDVVIDDDRAVIERVRTGREGSPGVVSSTSNP